MNEIWKILNCTSSSFYVRYVHGAMTREILARQKTFSVAIISGTIQCDAPLLPWISPLTTSEEKRKTAVSIDDDIYI